MLRTMILAALLAFTLNGISAFAADGGTTTLKREDLPSGNSRADQLGVGLQVGSLSGLNFEYWYAPSETFNAALTFTRGNTAVSLIHQWMFRDTFRGDARSFVPYVGGGALAVWANSSADSYNFNYNNDRFALAAQIPLGMEFLPANQRFSVFAEIAPSVEVVPYTVGFVNADLGARLFF